MPIYNLVVSVCAVSLAIGPALAGEPMKSDMMMTMMKSGEVVAIMPDGHMGTSKVADSETMASMKTAKPLKSCTMFMVGSDGKTMMVDSPDATTTAACEKVAK